MPGQTSLWWLPWVAVLSAFAGVMAAQAWRRGRRAVAIRRVGWTIAPWAAWLLGLFTLGWRVVDAFGDWGTRFVFNPAAWLGFAATGVALVLIWAGTRFGGTDETGPEADESDSRRQRRQDRRAVGRQDRRAVERQDRRAVESGSSSGDDDLADIEAILKKRGIS